MYILIMINKNTTFVNDNYWFKTLVSTNQSRLRMKDCDNKTLGTSKIYSPMSPPSLIISIAAPLTLKDIHYQLTCASHCCWLSE